MHRQWEFSFMRLLNIEVILRLVSFESVCRADDTSPYYTHVSRLPRHMGGVRRREKLSYEGYDTPVRVWPVLAYMQADTPFMAAAMGACGHAGHRACWRCGSHTTPCVLATGKTGSKEVGKYVIFFFFLLLVPQVGCCYHKSSLEMLSTVCVNPWLECQQFAASNL